MKYLIKVLINAVALIITANIIKGIHVESLQSAVISAFILGLVNAVIKPIMLLITLPINFLTLGLFTLVINGLMLWITSLWVQGFTIDNLFYAVLGSVALSIVSTILSFFVHD